MRWEPGRAGERRQREDPGDAQAEGRRPGSRPVLTEWATPHRNTPTSGSAARNTFTFCCTKCFFLVLEAKPNPGPGPPAAAGAVAGGTEEDAMVSRAPERVGAGAGRDSEARPGSGAHLRDRHVTGGPPSGARAGRAPASWLRPLGRAAVTWRGLRSLGCGLGTEQGGASVASGSVQFLVGELCPETPKTPRLYLKPVSLPSPGWLQTCYSPASFSYQAWVLRKCGLVLHEVRVVK